MLHQDVSLKAGEIPLYRSIASDIKVKIERGEYSFAIPNKRQLAEEYETSTGTIELALSLLSVGGFVIRKLGIGTFVLVLIDNWLPIQIYLRKSQDNLQRNRIL